MPRDPDEDTSVPPIRPGAPRPTPAGAPRPRPAGAPAPAAAPRPADSTPPTPPPLRWGVAGVLHTTGELAAFPGDRGIIRSVTDGVKYNAPPIAAQWRPSPTDHGLFEMPWDGEPATARTLRTLRKDLEAAARAGQLRDRRHALLRELDGVAAELATLAEQLHARGWSLGLLQPDNVVIRDRGGDPEVIPVDLGFTWKGTIGRPPWDESPGRPEWLEPTVQARWLWEHEPARQQFGDPKNGVFPPAGPESDIRLLGRLFAWLISGQASRDLPRVGGPDGPPPTWAVVSDAAGGRIPSAAELSERLRDAPLREYFAPMEMEKAPVRATASKGGSKLPLILGGLLLLAAAGAGAWYYFTQMGKKPETASTEPGTGGNGGGEVGTVTGIVFVDANGNGARDEGEPGQPGVTVFVEVNGEEKQAQTDAQGHFTLTLPPGDHKVRQKPVPKYKQTTPDPAPVTLAAGATAKDIRFGNHQEGSPPTMRPGTITGVVFVDKNGNGKRDEGEPGQPGVSVYVDQNGNGVRDPEEPAVKTDAMGDYTLPGLPTDRPLKARQEVPKDHKQTTADPAEITLTADSTTRGIDFGNLPGQSPPDPMLPPIAKKIDELIDIYKKAKGTKPPEAESKKIEAARVAVVSEWMKEVEAADMDATTGVTNTKRLEAAERFVKLGNRLKALVGEFPAADPKQRALEEQCLDYVTRRSVEYGAQP